MVYLTIKYDRCFRLQVWKRLESWEVTCHTVTVELESTESIHMVEVKLVVCTIWESTSTNSKLGRWVMFPYSHPGYFGKCGMRVFHLQRNRYFCPTVNTDKLWSLVSEQTRLQAQKSKDRVPVIDVTKSVNYYYIWSWIRASLRCSAREFSQKFQWSLRPRLSPRPLKRESRKPVELAFLLLEGFIVKRRCFLSFNLILKYSL